MNAIESRATGQLSEIRGAMDELVELYKRAVAASNAQLADVTENAAALMAVAESSTVQARVWADVALGPGANEGGSFVPNEWASKALIEADGKLAQAQFLKEFVARTLP